MISATSNLESSYKNGINKNSHVPIHQRFDSTNLLLEKKQQFTSRSPVIPIVLGIVNLFGLSFIQQASSVYILTGGAISKVTSLQIISIDTLYPTYYFSCFYIDFPISLLLCNRISLDSINAMD